MWECFLSSFTDPKTVYIAAYVQYNLAYTFSIHNNLSHPISSLESMVLDFSFEDKTLHIINVYHCIPDNPCSHSLLHLLSHKLDPLLPTLLIGDINTHSYLWSFPYSTISPWASELVDWFDDQGLELLNPPCIAIWESSHDDGRPLVLDLALINEATAISGQISSLHIFFEKSIFLDHTALCLL